MSGFESTYLQKQIEYRILGREGTFSKVLELPPQEVCYPLSLTSAFRQSKTLNIIITVKRLKRNSFAGVLVFVYIMSGELLPPPPPWRKIPR